ncbi:MAG: YbbR-like domain-containing protein [Bacillota bacterium]
MKSPRKIKFFGYKIAAVALAVLLWIYVMQVQNPLTEQIYTVSLEPRNLAADYILSDQSYQIQVRVEGNKQFLDNTTAKDLEAYADFEGLEVGQHTVKVEVIAPEQMEVVSVNPQKVTVNVEKLQTKSFYPEVKIAGKVEGDYMMLTPVVTPEQVKISGSASYLERIDQVYVTVDVSDLNNNFQRSLTIEAADDKGDVITQWLTVTPQFVDVFIPIISQAPEKLVPIEVAIVGEPASGYLMSRIIVEPSFLAIYGDLDTLLEIPNIVTAPIDISGATKTLNQAVDLVVDKRITLGAASKVTVSIQIEASKSRLFENIGVYEQNLADQLTAQIKDPTVTARVFGPASSIDALKEGDIMAYVDCSDLGTGSYSLPVKISSPANISSQSISPVKVDVVISYK